MSTPRVHEAFNESALHGASGVSTSGAAAPEASAAGLALAAWPDPPGTGDHRVDGVLAEFVRQSADNDGLGVCIEAATDAHRQLQARLSADREY